MLKEDTDIVKDVALLTVSRHLFYKRGTPTLNAEVTMTFTGVCNIIWSNDLRAFHRFLINRTSPACYDASLEIHLYVVINILK